MSNEERNSDTHAETTMEEIAAGRIVRLATSIIESAVRDPAVESPLDIAQNLLVHIHEQKPPSRQEGATSDAILAYSLAFIILGEILSISLQGVNKADFGRELIDTLPEYARHIYKSQKSKEEGK